MKRRAFVLFVVLSGLSSVPGAHAQAPTAPPTEFGVLLMAHGGTPEWDKDVLDAVQPLKGQYTIEVAFGMADPVTIQDAARKLEAKGVRRIGVVRLFISGESWLERTEQILGLRIGAPERPKGGAPDPHVGHAGHHNMDLWRIDTRASFALTRQGLAEADGMGEILAARAGALSRNPRTEDVMILGHGPGDDAENARWLAAIDARADIVRRSRPFRRVAVMTLREDWPEKRPEAEKKIRGFVETAKAEGRVAIVIPFRLQGFGPYAEVLEGLNYVSDGHGLIPHPNVTRWIEDEIKGLLAASFRAPIAR